MTKNLPLLDAVLRHRRPLVPVPSDVVPRSTPFSDVRAVIFDVYGTLIISGCGEVGGVLAMENKYTWKAVQGNLKKKGVTVLSAGADEVPGAYKKIEDVMAAQSGLVEIVSRFDPKIVKMCDDGSKAED